MLKPSPAELAARGFVKVTGTQSLYRDPKAPDLLLKLVDTLDDAAACGGIYGWDQVSDVGRWFALGGFALAVAKGDVAPFMVPTCGRLQGILRGGVFKTSVAEHFACNVYWGAEALVKVVAATVTSPRFLAVVCKGVQGAGYLSSYVAAEPAGLSTLASNGNFARASLPVPVKPGSLPIQGALTGPTGLTTNYIHAAVYQDLDLIPDMAVFFNDPVNKARVLADVPDDLKEHYSTAYDAVAGLEKYKGMKGTLRLMYTTQTKQIGATGTDLLKLHLVTKLGLNTWRYATQGNGSVPGIVIRTITGGPAVSVYGPQVHAGARFNTLLSKPMYGVPALAHEWSHIAATGSTQVELNEMVALNGTVPFKDMQLPSGQMVDFRDVLVGLAPYNVSRGNYGVGTLALAELLQNVFGYLRDAFDLSGAPGTVPSDPLALDATAAGLQDQADGFVVNSDFLEVAYRFGTFAGACYQFIEELSNTAQQRNPENALEIGYAPPNYRNQLFFSLLTTGATPSRLEFRGDRLLVKDGIPGGSVYAFDDVDGGNRLFSISSGDGDHMLVEPTGVVNIPGRGGADFPGRVRLGGLSRWGGFFDNGGHVEYIGYNFLTDRFEKTDVVLSHTPQGVEHWGRTSAGQFILYRTTFPTATTFETRMFTISAGVLGTGVVLTGKRVIAVREGYAMFVDASGLYRHVIGSDVAELTWATLGSLSAAVAVASSAFTSVRAELLDGSHVITPVAGTYLYGDIHQPFGADLPEFLLDGPWKRNATGTELIALGKGKRVPASAPMPVQLGV